MTGVKICAELSEESLAGFLSVLIIAGPSMESWVLKGAREGEGDGIGVGAFFYDGGEVRGGLGWGLAAREKNYAAEPGRNMSIHNGGGGAPNFGGGGLLTILLAVLDHVDFVDAGTEVDIMVYEGGG